MPTKALAKAKRKSPDGYINVRITKKAYRKIMERALKDRRNFVNTVDIIAGV